MAPRRDHPSAGWTAAQAAAFAPEPALSPDEALAEATRCLQCFDPPCQRHCPAGIAIPRFIRMIRSGNLGSAAEVVRSANPLAGSCGLACPDEQYCAAACTRARIDRPIAIRRLHRHATEAGETLGARPVRSAERLGCRVAVVGAGPAGLACAGELWRLGIDVDIHEARARAGGVLAHAIPAYRFADRALAGDVRWIAPEERAGGAGSTRRRVARGPASLRILDGRPVRDLAALAARYDALYVAPGAVARQPALPGAELRGVSSALEFLERCRRRNYRNPVGRSVVVIGGGNVAVDAAMAAVRCGLNGSDAAGTAVHLVYRRERAAMPAWDREIREAERVGVQLHLQVAPIAIEGDRGRVAGIRLQRTRPGAPDRSGRPRPVAVPGDELALACDRVLLATGLEPPALADQLPRSRARWIRVQPATGLVRDNVYAGGDAVGSDQTIVAAVRDGKAAARAIAARLRRSR
ncbi:MAG: FAD-dependent oxidoreductase [Candidatus Krumholzibacteriia bacterium]